MCGSKELYVHESDQILIFCEHCGTATVFAPEYNKDTAIKLFVNRYDNRVESVSKIEKIMFRVVAILSTAVTVMMAVVAMKCAGVI